MSLLNTVTPEQATGELAEIYAQIAAMRGGVPNSSQLWSLSPELLKQQLSFIGYYMSHKTLSKELLACIRLKVSEDNGCKYCIGFNASMLINMFGWSQEQVDAAKKDPKDANLSPKEVQMLLFVLKAVKTPHDVNPSDIDTLHSLGYSDGDILDATNHGARMSAIDIMFNAFKIENDF